MGLIKDSINTLTATKKLYTSFDADKDCPTWLDEEWKYISSLQHEPETEQVRIMCLQAIKHLECAE